jgi:hypothetical protein
MLLFTVIGFLVGGVAVDARPAEAPEELRAEETVPLLDFNEQL